MRISGITNTNFRTYRTKISFKENNETVQKSENDIKIEQLNKSVNKVRTRMAQEEYLYGTQYSLEKLKRDVFNARSLQSVRERYEEFDDFLTRTTGFFRAKDKIELIKFIEETTKIKDDTGFNRIYGYDDIKDYLYKEFVIKVIGQDKTSIKTDVPNAILMYGPTGCGKTLFARSLSEQGLCNTIVVKSNRTDSYEDVFKKVLNYARESKQNYDESGDKKQRTAIVLDEAEWWLNSDSPVLDEFKTFLKDCAEKYKCTLFLTSNSPLTIDKSILTPEVTPFKIMIPPSDKESTEAILKGCMEKLERPEIDTKKLVDILYQDENRIYSNAQLEQIVLDAGVLHKKASFEDYSDSVELFHSDPHIKKSDIEKYEKMQEYFNQMSENL